MTNHKKLKLLALMFGWLAVIAIGLLSLVPGDTRPHTGAPGEIEHVAAYFGAAALLTFGHEEKRGPLVIVLCLSLYSVALEVAQIYIAGRHAAFLDFVVSSAGGLAGAASVWIALKALSYSARVRHNFK